MKKIVAIAVAAAQSWWAALRQCTAITEITGG
jgi:hypothetical protein